MSGVVTAVLNATFGLLVNKTRDLTAKKLEKGDLTDEECRKLIVRELDDIKSKLDGLARKDLLSSVSFFEEGVCRLYLSIDTDSRNDETEQEENENIHQATRATMMEASYPQCSRGEGSVLDEALTSLKLSRAVGISGLKITSEERFRSAKESFKESRKEATRAFSNEALSTEDRILAIKLRMASTILESVEDPDAAANDCQLYLRALHAMPAVREMFSVYLDGGIIRSRLNKTRRFEIVKSVTMVNVALFGFTKAFTKAPVDLFNWPRIEIGKRSYHPLYDQETKILREMKNSGVEVPSLGVITCALNEHYNIANLAVNSKREIIIVRWGSDVDVLNSQGEIKLFCSLPQEVKEARCLIHSLAIDDKDNVYIVTSFKQTDSFKLFVFDPEGNLKHQFPLEILSRKKAWVQIAINMAENIIIHEYGKSRVHVCNKDGQLQHSFPLKESVGTVFLNISEKDEIVVAPHHRNTVYIYTEGELKQTIKLPKDHKVQGVVSNHVTKNVIVHTVKDPKTHQLLSYSETVELQTLPLLSDDLFGQLTSHPSGPVAYVHRNGVLFI